MTVIRGILAFLIGLTLALALKITFAQAHWKPEYAQLSPQMQHWFQGLKNKQTQVPCCDLADGVAANEDDVEYDTKDNHYRVRIKGKWYDVPPEAVIEEPNKFGRTVVWYYYHWDGNKDAEQTVVIRCFMPGGGV